MALLTSNIPLATSLFGAKVAQRLCLKKKALITSWIMRAVRSCGNISGISFMTRRRCCFAFMQDEEEGAYIIDRWKLVRQYIDEFNGKTGTARTEYKFTHTIIAK